ncbi:hypothetical protein EIL87_15295 [Saccharopolyspora rhizosphaerae]|uniref:Excalibur calcium-binding domain-containing protein n=1 Tax=Saccharopolyspora rhizosphaerae TaxID=2492662 RepID=A0A3R8P2Y1_9PSEU|nr:hypothetical protein [Saccharopolyspora rhizosphaerae]RRO15429.1 hypothetical protein EIL87_15295 [Saccharopolyspora rhizosphaerae]
MKTRLVPLGGCAALLVAASACTINIVPPGATPPPAPAPATAPPQAPTVAPPTAVEQQETVRTTDDCRELRRSGMSFTDVVQYWYGLGSPVDMDDDRDGIPCETIYGEKNGPSTTPRTPTHDCATLQAQGMSFAEVTDYWYGLGSPSDMDDDSDGIPCETIYGDR